MKNKKGLVAIALSIVVLASCGKLEKGTSNISPNQATSEKTITTGRVDGNSYQALLVEGKYKTSKARGVTANLMNSNFNSANYEKGLLDLSKKHYSVDKFLFQEGQMLSRDDILRLVNRKSDKMPDGLNPEKNGGPIVIQQFLEQDYINPESEKVEGISLGIALNKVDYSEEVPVEIDDATIQAEGERAAAAILEKIRSNKELEKVPVMFGLFVQATKDNVGGGHYFATAVSKEGNKIGAWDGVNEEYIVLPVSSDAKNSATQDGLANKYNDFKNSVQSFFPNSSGISAVALYRDNELVKFSIIIETKYFSETEIINFTQFIGQTVETIFNMNGNIEVQVNTLEGPQSFVKKQIGSDKVETTIFN